MNKEILDGNKLIVEFMELKPTELKGMYSVSHNHCTCQESTPEKALDRFASIAKYHESWDWLMPVLEKVMAKCFELEEESDKDLIEWFYCIRDFIPDINSTHSAIVEFIEWYNENKNK
jgi:hypothetical protein